MSEMNFVAELFGGILAPVITAATGIIVTLLVIDWIIGKLSD